MGSQDSAVCTFIYREQSVLPVPCYGLAAQVPILWRWWAWCWDFHCWIFNNHVGWQLYTQPALLGNWVFGAHDPDLQHAYCEFRFDFHYKWRLAWDFDSYWILWLPHWPRGLWNCLACCLWWFSGMEKREKDQILPAALQTNSCAWDFQVVGMFLPFGNRGCHSKYTRAEVDKDAHGSYLTAKAWNSRVLLEWLNDAALAAATRDLPQAAEPCFWGEWLLDLGVEAWYWYPATYVSLYHAKYFNALWLKHDALVSAEALSLWDLCDLL